MNCIKTLLHHFCTAVLFNNTTDKGFIFLIPASTLHENSKRTRFIIGPKISAGEEKLDQQNIKTDENLGRHCFD